MLSLTAEMMESDIPTRSDRKETLCGPGGSTGSASDVQRNLVSFKGELEEGRNQKEDWRSENRQEAYAGPTSVLSTVLAAVRDPSVSVRLAGVQVYFLLHLCTILVWMLHDGFQVMSTE